jgi:ribonuclease HI
MRVTIIADASHCSDTGASGYGYWIASERGKHGGGGSVRTKVSGSIAAEMIAIVNAIDVAVKRELLQKGDHAKEIFFELKRGAGFTFSFRHVKGHTSNTEARFVTNNLCDKRARKAMQLARRMLGETENV